MLNFLFLEISSTRKRKALFFFFFQEKPAELLLSSTPDSWRKPVAAPAREGLQEHGPGYDSEPTAHRWGEFSLFMLCMVAAWYLLIIIKIVESMACCTHAINAWLTGLTLFSWGIGWKLQWSACLFFFFTEKLNFANAEYGCLKHNCSKFETGWTS